jgi:predicted transcriptional regulator
MNLRDYLEMEGIKKCHFAKRVNITESTLHSIMSGRTDPRLSICLRIEKATGRKVKCQELASPLLSDLE